LNLNANAYWYEMHIIDTQALIVL